MGGYAHRGPRQWWNDLTENQRQVAMIVIGLAAAVLIGAFMIAVATCGLGGTLLGTVVFALLVGIVYFAWRKRQKGAAFRQWRARRGEHADVGLTDRHQEVGLPAEPSLAHSPPLTQSRQPQELQTRSGRKQCPKCKELIDKGATKCPHCRSTQPPPLAVTIIAVALIIGLGLWGYHSCSSITNSPEAKEETAKHEKYGDKLDAWIMAQEFVTKSLKAPSTADYGDGFLKREQDPEKCVTDLGSGRYAVHGWVDAQNSFGAKIRTHFALTIQCGGNGTWRCVEGPDLVEP